jgi:hypothetical protein
MQSSNINSYLFLNADHNYSVQEFAVFTVVLYAQRTSRVRQNIYSSVRTS